MLTDTAAPAGTALMNSQTDAYVKHWRVLPSWSAPTIDSEKKLALLEKFEAPLLGGGLGSMMFQIAMVSSFFLSYHLIPVCTSRFNFPRIFWHF